MMCFSEPHKVPEGLMHILLHYGNDRKKVYSRLYSILVFGQPCKSKNLKKGTLVFPNWVKNAIRQRFNENGGKYDNQYKGKHVYEVTTVDLINAVWPEPKQI